MPLLVVLDRIQGQVQAVSYILDQLCPGEYVIIPSYKYCPNTNAIGLKLYLNILLYYQFALATIKVQLEL